MKIKTIAWQNNRIKIIDQTKLPAKLEYLYIDNLKILWSAIKVLKVRGAPALGAAAGLGVYLGIRNTKVENYHKFMKELRRVIDYIGSSRPTAKNLFWGLERIRKIALLNKHKPITSIKKLLLQEALKIVEEDRASCREIGSYGAKLIKDKDRVLTVCNAGILATIDYGTALGVLYRAKEKGKNLKIYACETRPLLQGSRLTMWELKKKGMDATLICDNMAASLMAGGKIDKVIAGADRIALNGDTANKIGTYNLAVLAKYHKIPFYIAAPVSTFDLSISSGKDIPIEERSSQEVRTLLGKKKTAPEKTKVFNPAFDVTEHKLITAIITDRGGIKPPFIKNIRKIISR